MAEEERFVRVAVDAPLSYPLTYKSAFELRRGQSVVVPLGKRQTSAVVLDATAGQPDGDFKIREIFSADDEKPTLSATFLKWLEWISEYYVYPIGQVAALAFPPLTKRTKPRVSKKTAVVKSVERKPKPNLTEEQARVVDNIKIDSGFRCHLVHGVTGSGKTEIYLRLLEQVVNSSGSGLVLVPEISLTPQLIQRFTERFGDQVAVLHSHLTDRERTEQWWAAVSGEKKILVGARSALFCPLPNLQLIVVDEEHEPSYKQEEKLRYHARDCAVMLAKFANVPAVLGSATPSLESWQNAQTGKYQLHSLHSRVADRQMPKIEVVDLRALKAAANTAGVPARPANLPARPFWLSEPLADAIHIALSQNEQVALFLNRRGMANTILCPSCGHVQRCPNCSITLTLHGQRDLVCHYCDYHEILRENCPSCREGELKKMGLGTEQLENDLKDYFSSARVSRADRDEIHSRETLEQLIEQMENHEIDILVGTQMIAKGLDFPKLSLVGLVLADIGFNIPDFRSTERSFQLLTQMSGRAGRHKIDGGRVIIQTYNPENPALVYTLSGNFAAFADHELAARQELGYPPFGRLAAIRVVARDNRRGESTIEQVAARAEALRKRHEAYKSVQVLGPAEAPISRLRGQFRYHVLFKSGSSNVLGNFCRQILGTEDWIPSGTKVQVDIDPVNLM